MPTYVYRFVDSGETVEVQQGFHDDTLTELAHPDSGEIMAVKKVFTPVGVTFKGSGFFKTDNRGKQSASSTASSSSNGSSSSDSSTSSDSKSETTSSDSKKSDASSSDSKKSDSKKSDSKKSDASSS